MKTLRILRTVMKSIINVWVQLFCLVCEFLSHRERERTPSFLGTSREHGTSIVSCALMGLLKGVKYSLSNFLNWLWGFRYFLVVQWCLFWVDQDVELLRKKSFEFFQIVHYVLCVIVVYVVVILDSLVSTMYPSIW